MKGVAEWVKQGRNWQHRQYPIRIVELLDGFFEVAYDIGQGRTLFASEAGRTRFRLQSAKRRACKIKQTFFEQGTHEE